MAIDCCTDDASQIGQPPPKDAQVDVEPNGGKTERGVCFGDSIDCEAEVLGLAYFAEPKLVEETEIHVDIATYDPVGPVIWNQIQLKDTDLNTNIKELHFSSDGEITAILLQRSTIFESEAIAIARLDEQGTIRWHSQLSMEPRRTNTAVAPDGSFFLAYNEITGDEQETRLEKYGADGEALWSWVVPQPHG